MKVTNLVPAIALLVTSPANAGFKEGMIDNPIPLDSGTVLNLISGAAACFSIDNPTLQVDCNLNRVTVGGTNGLRVSSGPVILDGTGVSLRVAGSTMTVANSGIVSAPAQVGAKLRISVDQPVATSAIQLVYWDNEQFDNQNMHSNTISSGAATVPVGGAGLYFLSCSIAWPVAGAVINSVNTYIYVNGTPVCTGYGSKPASVSAIVVTATCLHNLSAGATLECKAYQNSAGSMSIATAGDYVDNSFNILKIW